MLFASLWCSECRSDSAFVDELLASLRSAEQRIKLAEWRCDMTVSTLSDPADADSIDKQLPNQVHSFVRIDPHQGRYLAKLDAIVPWEDGLTNFAGRTKGISYDGKVYRVWHRHVKGPIFPPPTTYAFAAISEDPDDVGKRAGRLFETWAYSLGTGFVFPYFESFEGPGERAGDKQLQFLSEFLSEKNKSDSLAIEAVGDIWELSTWLPSLQCPLVIRYCPSKRAVVSAIWGDTAPDKSWRRWDAEIIEAEPNVWVPRLVTVVSRSSTPPEKVEFAFSDFRVNAARTKNDFCVQFPNGARVDDYVKQAYYVEGKEPHITAESRRAFADRDRGLRHKER